MALHCRDSSSAARADRRYRPLHRQPAVHVKFAELQIGMQQKFRPGPAVVQPDRNARLAGAEGFLAAIRVNDRQGAMAQKWTQKKSQHDQIPAKNITLPTP